MLAGVHVDRNVEGPVARPVTSSRAEIEVIRSERRSVVSRAYAENPLKLLTPRNDGSAAWIYTSTYGGGLVDGDEVDVHVKVGPAASAMCTTQASTKIYRSPRGVCAGLNARVLDGGLLASLPDPVVCFAGANYRQHQTFGLAEGASLVHVDWLTCGRRGHGERWAFESYRSTLDIRSEGRLVCHDALTLAAADGSIGDRLSRFDVLATVVLLGPIAAPCARQLLAADAERAVAPRADQLHAVSPIGQGAGVLVRLADVSLERAAATIRSWLNFLPASLGDDPWARKW